MKHQCHITMQGVAALFEEDPSLKKIFYLEFLHENTHILLHKIYEIEDLHDILMPLSINLLLINDTEMQKLNSEHRQIPKTTDVLSFPNFPLHPKCKLSRKFLKESSWPINSQEPLALGDIIISLETCRKQANEANILFVHEFYFLFIHGLLHLLGYDHEKDEKEAQEMRKKEKLLLKVAETFF